ncbi:uncharacterized protein DFL_005626 [Arthrobotrys flagrans]|uniref:Uncharacterized protein n=1 Tax=Arthrobotrys flagrans TaxID=97331 RepID=A0A436ZYJ1_ARTFL|nr:hypothetical protein DFL_005626 [Arthrobotrys flagrans]
METFQLLHLTNLPKTNITSLPLELLEDISLHVGKVKFHYSWNLCLANKYLYETIGPSNNFLWYEIVGRFDIGKATKFIKYHKDFNYATLARRKSAWPDPRCCGCEVSGQELKMIQNWSQFRILVYLLFCQKCLDKYYVSLTSIAELRATDPVLQHFFSSHPALNSICHVYWNRRSELVSKELYNHVKNIFNIDASEPLRILTDSEIKEIQEKASMFIPTFVPPEHHRHVHGRKYLEGVTEIYRREYTSLHFLCTPEYLEELWEEYDKLMRRLKRDRIHLTSTFFEDTKTTGMHDPRLAFNYFRFDFHRNPRYGLNRKKYISEEDYQTELSEYEGQKAIITRHKYCQQALVSLFGPGDGIAWRASRVQWPEFLMALFNQWHRSSFGSGLWLPDRPVARCPYCYGFFQGSVGGDTSTKDLWRSEPENLLDHILGEHRDMVS